LPFSSLDETSFLPFDTTGVVPEETQVLKGGSGRHIESLNGLSDGWDTRFTLAGQTTSSNFYIHIQQACVGSYSQGQQNAVPLRGLKEVLKDRPSIDSDFATSSLYIGDSCRCLSLSMSPGLSFTIDFRLAFLLGKSTTEIEDGNSIELNEIIRVDVVGSIG
jgi:hypothetical protein